MEMLEQSIRENGLFSPIIVRPRGESGYEIISGHRRVYACQKAGIQMIPAFIQQMSREDAVICMVDSNLQRDRLLPSEKAFAYKMKMDALRHRGIDGQNGHGHMLSRDVIANSESGRTVQRYIRLTNLEKPLLDLVDQGRIALTSAVELSYLPREKQNIIVQVYETDEILPSYSQTVRMRKECKKENLTEERIREILAEEKGNQKEYLKLPMDRCGRYLTRYSTPREKEEFILKSPS